jgi:hypothetical protein
MKTRKYRKKRNGGEKGQTTRNNNRIRYKTGMKSIGPYSDNYYYSFNRAPELWNDRVKRHCGESKETYAYNDCKLTYGDSLLTPGYERKQTVENEIKKEPKNKNILMLNYLREEFEKPVKGSLDKDLILPKLMDIVKSKTRDSDSTVKDAEDLIDRIKYDGSELYPIYE